MKVENLNQIESMLKHYGPSLSAVWDNDNLNGNEKLLMFYLTRSLNMKGSVTDFRQALNYKRIEKATTFSESKAKRVVKGLVAKGYVERIKCTTKSGKQLENAYVVTPKVFEEYRVFLTHLNTKFMEGDRTIFARESVIHKATDADQIANVVHHREAGFKIPSEGVSKKHPSGGFQNDRPEEFQNDRPILSNNNNSKLVILSDAPEVLAENEKETPTEQKTEAESTNTPEPIKKPRKTIKKAKKPEVVATREVLEHFEMVIGERKITSVEFNKLKTQIKKYVTEFDISFEEVTAVSKEAVTVYARSREPFAIEYNHSFQVFIQGFSKYYCKAEAVYQKTSRYEENEEYGLGPIVLEDEVS